MQKFIRNIFLFFFINAAFTNVATAQSAVAELLAHADSLYEKGKYKEAEIVYKQILEQRQSYSEQMLAKVAFIAEGAENYDEALYYLNLLYARKRNEALYDKIMDLAARYELPGYVVTDEEFVIYALRSYMPFWGSLLIGLTGLLMYYIIWRYRKRKTFAAAALLWIVTASGIIYAMQTVLTPKTAIIRREKAFVMSAPAAGAELIFTARRGHCFRVTDSRDIWCQVQWEDKTGYVRRNNLWMIE